MLLRTVFQKNVRYQPMCYNFIDQSIQAAKKKKEISKYSTLFQGRGTETIEKDSNVVFDPLTVDYVREHCQQAEETDRRARAAQPKTVCQVLHVVRKHDKVGHGRTFSFGEWSNIVSWSVISNIHALLRLSPFVVDLPFLFVCLFCF